MTNPEIPERTRGGLAGKLAGRMKQAAGSVLGNEDLAREGRLQQAQVEAEEAGRPAPQPAPAAVDEPARQLWDTGPIRLARSAARTIRPSRRPGGRVPTGV